MGLVIAVLVAFIGALDPDRGLFYRDHSLFFRPEWWSIYTQLREGTLPVLSLTHGSGQPHEASTNYALFTPLTLLLLAGPFEHTYDLFVVGHFAALAVGVFMLSVELGATLRAAAVVSAVSTFAGPIVSFDSLLVGLTGLAYTPWVWWALARTLRETSSRNVALLGLSTAFAAQGMMPELLLLHLLASAWIASHLRARLSAGLALSLSAAAVLAFMVAAVDLIPQIDALADSRRWSGFGRSEREGWAFSPLQFAELVAPALWASPNLYFFNVPVATGSAVDPPYLPSLYLGIALPLALAAPFAGSRTARWAALSGVFFLVVATGSATPLHDLVSTLPILRSGRFAIKYLVLLVPALSILVALTVLHLERRWRALVYTSGLHALVVLSLWAWSETGVAREWLSQVAEPFKNTTPFEAYRGDVIGMALAEMNASLKHGLGFSILLFLLSVLAMTRPSWRGRFGHGVVILLFLDLGLAVPFGVPLGPTHATELPGEPSAVFAAERVRVLVKAPRPVPHIEGQTAFEDHLVNHGRHALLSWALFRPFESHDLEGMGANRAHETVVGWLEKASVSETERLLARADVRFVVGTPSSLGREIVAFSDHVGRPLSVSALAEAGQPETSIYGSWLAASLSSTSARTLFLDPRFAERPIVWSDATSSSESKGCSPMHSPRGAQSRERRAFLTDAPCPSLLVVRELWYPRWVVLVDGREVTPQLVDAGFVGVVLPPGRHEVEVFYDSLTRRYWWVSGLGLLICLALAWPRRWPGRRSSAQRSHQAPGVHSKN